MKQLQIFEYEGAIRVRTIVIDAEPWFVATDVCSILDIKNVSQAIDRLDDDEKGISPIYTPRGEQEVLIVSESGLYNLIFRSNKPNAQKFRRWVTREVLPQIRRTGSYAPKAPTHVFVRRFNDNWDRTDAGYFSVMSELYIRLYGRFEQVGHTLAERARNGTELRPDISVGLGFAARLRDNLPEEVATVRKYWHLFSNGFQTEVNQYPNKLLPDFIRYVEEDWIPNQAARYFQTRDAKALEHLPKLLPRPKAA